ncbi:hypothetical protein [Streptomyces sp. NPDC058394]|uniref:hypothetical protein n=1 Tax=Streptomyces sp. NPDC058394 TaxID=3346477 RepID=UPI0036512454
MARRPAGGRTTDGGLVWLITQHLLPVHADRLFAAREAGSGEQELQNIVAEGLQEGAFKDSGRRANDLLVEFADINYPDTDYSCPGVPETAAAPCPATGRGLAATTPTRKPTLPEGLSTDTVALLNVRCLLSQDIQQPAVAPWFGATAGCVGKAVTTAPARSGSR